jgi:Tfp pilus assembly protein PilP
MCIEVPLIGMLFGKAAMILFRSGPSWPISVATMETMRGPMKFTTLLKTPLSKYKKSLRPSKKRLNSSTCRFPLENMRVRFELF